MHLQHGPIDLIVAAYGTPEAVEAAYRAAAGRFVTILDELCHDLSTLRSQATTDRQYLTGPVARRMARAVAPFAAETFITPMAAVAGAVAEEILAALVSAAPLDRASVNNGGDIAIHLVPGRSFTIGLVDRPDRPGLFGRTRIEARHDVRGIATSGWRGRSFSLGIADAVTVLARTAAEADAAATVIANAIDLPGHPGVHRRPAASVQVDSDLGDRLVTRGVDPLGRDEIETALASGLRCAEDVLARGLIVAAALHCQGRTRAVGQTPDTDIAPHAVARPTIQSFAHA